MMKPALIIAAGFLMLATNAWAQRQSSGDSNEIYIKQETGHYNLSKPVVPLNTPAKGALEGTMTTAPAGATSPNTCDPKNATSSACYTATQQGHK